MCVKCNCFIIVILYYYYCYYYYYYIQSAYRSIQMGNGSSSSSSNSNNKLQWIIMEMSSIDESDWLQTIATSWVGKHLNELKVHLKQYIWTLYIFLFFLFIYFKIINSSFQLFYFILLTYCIEMCDSYFGLNTYDISHTIHLYLTWQSYVWLW